MKIDGFDIYWEHGLCVAQSGDVRGFGETPGAAIAAAKALRIRDQEDIEYARNIESRLMEDK